MRVQFECGYAIQATGRFPKSNRFYFCIIFVKMKGIVKYSIIKATAYNEQHI